MAPALSGRAARAGWWGAGLLALAYLVVMVVTGALPHSRQLVTFDARGVLSADPSQVDAVMLRADGATLVFRRSGEGWVGDDGQALSRQSASTLSRAVKFMHTATPVRVFAPGDADPVDVAGTGIEDPRLIATLSRGPETLLEASFGDLNADGFLQYMRVRGRGELYLMSRFVGAEWAAVAAARRP